MVTDDLRALDAEVHRKVMGGSVDYPATDTSLAYTVVSPAPRYSTDTAAAWLVVERLTDEEYVKVRLDVSHDRGYFCCITAAHESQRAPDCLVRRDVFAEGAETAPLAICRAALKATAAQPTNEVK